jgi:hypothetical protein
MERAEIGNASFDLGSPARCHLDVTALDLGFHLVSSPPDEVGRRLSSVDFPTQRY